MVGAAAAVVQWRWRGLRVLRTGRRWCEWWLSRRSHAAITIETRARQHRAWWLVRRVLRWRYSRELLLRVRHEMYIAALCRLRVALDLRQCRMRFAARALSQGLKFGEAVRPKDTTLGFSCSISEREARRVNMHRQREHEEKVRKVRVELTRKWLANKPEVLVQAYRFAEDSATLRHVTRSDSTASIAEQVCATLALPYSPPLVS